MAATLHNRQTESGRTMPIRKKKKKKTKKKHTHTQQKHRLGVQLLVFFCSSVSVDCSTPQGSPGVSRSRFLSSPHLCFVICDLFVFRDDPLMS